MISKLRNAWHSYLERKYEDMEIERRIREEDTREIAESLSGICQSLSESPGFMLFLRFFFGFLPIAFAFFICGFVDFWSAFSYTLAVALIPTSILNLRNIIRESILHEKRRDKAHRLFFCICEKIVCFQLYYLLNCL